MKKGFLMIVLLGGIMASLVGCVWDAGPVSRDEAVEYYDLIAIDKSTVPDMGYGNPNKEAYVFIFEESERRLAYYSEVDFKFDQLLEKPVVKALLRRIIVKGVDPTDDGKLFEVTVTFKDREQMKEYLLY